MQWGSEGSGDGEFLSPSSVATDSMNNIYVADSGNNRIQKFDSSGTYLAQWHVENVGSLAIDNSDQVFARISTGIQKFDATGTLLTGWDVSRIRNSLDVDNAGRVYTLTTDNRVLLFDNNGAYLNYMPVPAGFPAPNSTAVAVDSLGKIYVRDTDGEGGRIVKTGPLFPRTFLLDDPTVDDGDYISHTITGLAGGTYIESIPVGWALESIECTTDGVGDDPIVESDRVTVSLASGNVTCIFNNVETVVETGNITIAHEATPADGTDFQFQATSPLYASSYFSHLESWVGERWGDRGNSTDVGSIDVDSTNHVFAISPGDYRVRKYAPDGTFLMEWVMDYPRGLAVDNEDHVLVIDSSFIKKFDSSGTLLAQWGGTGDGTGLFRRPTAIAVDAVGHVFVSDVHLGLIQKFDSDGTFITQWGGLSNLYDMAVDGDGYVYAGASHSIMKFNNDGAFLLSWGARGDDNGEFLNPFDIDVDAANRIFVVDEKLNRVQVFDAMGTYLTQWGTWGIWEGQFQSPQDIVIDNFGDILVSDTGNERLQKFTPYYNNRISSIFTLDDALPDDGDDITNLAIFSNMAGGEYTFSSILPENWVVDSISCVTDDAGDAPVVLDDTVTIQLDTAENVTCTFYHSRPPGNITIVHAASPTDGTDFTFTTSPTSTLPSTFLLDDAVPDDADGVIDRITFADIEAGTYTFTELVPTEWQIDSIICITDDSGDVPIVSANTVIINLNAEENITCTFHNSRLPDIGMGNITIVHDASPADGTDFTFTTNPTSTLPSTFILDDAVPDDADGVVDRVTFTNIEVGTYIFTELVPTDWQLDNIICTTDDSGDAPVVSGNTVTINLDTEENVTCTFFSFTEIIPLSEKVFIPLLLH